MRLTIAIPTYNFGRFIGETLDAFLTDLPDHVEILVVDGASTDDTATVVSARSDVGAVRYIRLAKRGGIDADVATAIELAKGEYVWMFSADDLPEAGAVQRILELLATRPDVIVVAHSGWTIDMQLVHSRYPIIEGSDVRVELSDPKQRDALFARGVTSEVFFSFLSGLIIRRGAWVEAPIEPGFFYGSCWAHAARLLATAARFRLDVLVHVEPLVRRRGDNDSFLTAGLVARYALAIEGYRAIFDAVFGTDAPEQRHLRRVMRNEFSLNKFLNAKLAHGRSVDERDHLRRLFDMIYPDRRGYSMARATLWFMPTPVIIVLKNVRGLATRVRQRLRGSVR